mgnify:FL=1
MTEWLGSLPGAVAQGLIWGLMAVGVYITYKILDIADLTVDGTICTGGAVCTMLILSGVNPWLSILLATLSGLLAGALTGFFHITLGIPAILSGILTQMILWSVNLKILGRANQALSARTYPVIVTLMKIPKSILLLVAFAAVTVAVLYWFFGTEVGSAVRATGNNPKMSRAQGINTDVMKVLGLAISNAIVALSGALLSQYQGFCDINMGRGAVVTGLAAVVIGTALVKRVSSNFAVRLSGVIGGAVVYYLVYQTVIFIGLDPDLLKMFSAIVVAVFLGAPYVRKKIAASMRTSRGGNPHA